MDGIDLDSWVKHKYTPAIGRVIGKACYVSGYVSILVQPNFLDKNNLPGKADWYSVNDWEETEDS